MKKTMFLLLLPLFSACGKNDTIYPLTETIWGTPEVLHVPDNVGFYSTKLGSYEFKSDGTYKAIIGSNTLEAKWDWLVKGEKFKLDYEGQVTHNEIFTILSMQDTLLHVKKRNEGESENNGNYWELKYRPY
ncbi:MAG: hypothetical protein H7246_19085 [Phycisphaerae bacterium]|nr:hypothetical protein [Saprospiraceae bacterium]